jgi:hypothetical protein
MITRTEETLSCPQSLELPLRFHPSLRGRWPAHPCSDRPNAANPEGEEDVLELVTIRAPRIIVMQSQYDGVTYCRTVCLANKAFVVQLAAFLKSQVGKTLSEIGNMIVDF